MNKLSQLIIVFIFTILLSINIFSQKIPETIDVRLMEINKSGAFNPTSFRMSGIDSSNEDFEYFVGDSSALLGNIQYFNCTPCRPLKVYNTNHFSNGLFISMGQSSLTKIKFTPTSTNSNLLYLSQMVLSRKRPFSIKGTTQMQGKIEILENGIDVSHLDNDVVLKGSFNSNFSKPYFFNGRKLVDFRGIKFSLEDNREASN